MFRKWLLIVIVILFPIQVIAVSLSDDEDESDTELAITESEHMQQPLRYTTNQFTQPENDETAPAAVNQSTEGYEAVAENEALSLFVDEESLGLKITDNRSGYVWSSGIDENEDYNLNETWMNIVQSAISIDYIDQNENSHSDNILSTETEIDLQSSSDGFSASIEFSEIEISLDLEVSLADDFIDVYIPESSISESENAKLTSLRVYPFLGAAHMNDIDGYMFVPDGSGALIRFDSHYNAGSPFQASVYGEDEGFQRTYQNDDDTDETNPVQNVTVPVYGVVHGANENGMFTIIEEGNYYSDIMAHPAGVSTDFNWITAEFQYRTQYYQPTSQDMSGYNTYQEERNEFDIKKRISFLEGNDADYVGMAQHYQQYLVNEGELAEEPYETDIRLEFLGGETEQGLLWDSVINMTDVTDLSRHVDRLKEQNVENMHVVYRGWTRGGFTGTLPEKFPFESRLGSQGDFADTIQYFNEQDIPLYFYTDYTKAYDGASGYSGRSDIARKINSETMANDTFGYNYFLLSPSVSQELAESDVTDYVENGISKLAIDTSASVLFTDFNANRSSTPDEMVDTYTDMLQLLNQEVGALSLYKPNDYMWGQMDRYLDIPMYSSNYRFVTDTVPFLQIVLKGYKSYYAPFFNFSHNRAEDVLRMVEYGAYPSFYLTTEPSSLLTNTPSQDLYTSEFDDWESEIVRLNDIMRESLSKVEGATIESRYVHDNGIVEVSYSNGKSIIVNYTTDPYSIGDIEVEPAWFKVTDSGSVS